MKRSTAASWGTLLALSVLAISPAVAQGQVESRPRQASQAVAPDNDGKITVRNKNWSDMRIYIVREGLATDRTRLGTVIGNSSAHLKVPERFLNETDRLQLVAIPIGAQGGVISDAFPAGWSDGVEWTIQQALYLSGRSWSGH